MKSAIDKLRERAEDILANAEVDAAQHLAELAKGTAPGATDPWGKAGSRQDKAALALAGWYAARARTNIAAKSGPRLFGVVVMPGQIADRKQWEARARELDAKVIDTTAGPAALEPAKKDPEK